MVSLRRTSLHFAMLAQMSMGIQTTEGSIVLDQRNYVIGMLERNCIGVARIFEGTTWFMLICMSVFIAFFVFDMTDNLAATIGVAASPILLLLATTKVYNNKSLVDILRTLLSQAIALPEADGVELDDTSLASSSLQGSSLGWDGGSFLEYLGNPFGGPTHRISSAFPASSLIIAGGTRCTGNRLSNASTKSGLSQQSHLVEGFNRDSYLQMTSTGAGTGTGTGTGYDGGSGVDAGAGAGSKKLKRAKQGKAGAMAPLSRPLVPTPSVSTIPEAQARESSYESNAKSELNRL